MYQIKFRDIAIPVTLILISLLFIVPRLEEIYDFKYFDALFVGLGLLLWEFWGYKTRRNMGASALYMQVEKAKKLLKNIGLIGGIIEIFFAGLVNSMYSDTRWPATSGITALWDFLIFSYSNPYALLSGVIFYLFFYRLAYNLEDLRAGKMDYILIVISTCLSIWIYIVYTGVLVYETL